MTNFSSSRTDAMSTGSWLPEEEISGLAHARAQLFSGTLEPSDRVTTVGNVSLRADTQGS